MDGGIGPCSVCLEEQAQLVKWANDECTHSFCNDCTMRLLDLPLPVCPICRRPPTIEHVRRYPPYEPRPLITGFMTLTVVIIEIIASLSIQVWRFTQTISPVTFVFWVVSIWVAFCASAAFSTVLCNANMLPNFLYLYNANKTIAYSWNITIMKHAIVYCREHTLFVDMMCQMITK